MSNARSVKVNRRHQIRLPNHVRQELGIEPGDHLIIMVQEGLLILLPQPKDWVEGTRGLHREVWQGIGTTAYLIEEREEWSTADQ